jgi:hypothetical protein
MRERTDRLVVNTAGFFAAVAILALLLGCTSNAPPVEDPWKDAREHPWKSLLDTVTILP